MPQENNPEEGVCGAHPCTQTPILRIGRPAIRAKGGLQLSIPLGSESPSDGGRSLILRRERGSRHFGQAAQPYWLRGCAAIEYQAQLRRRPVSWCSFMSICLARSHASPRRAMLASAGAERVFNDRRTAFGKGRKISLLSQRPKWCPGRRIMWDPTCSPSGRAIDADGGYVCRSQWIGLRHANG